VLLRTLPGVKISLLDFVRGAELTFHFPAVDVDWGDFFFLIDSELTFDGVFQMAPHPMYSIG